jgi:ABC-type nitrate/sulfonate/bicarbonate transport system substrate-binding protein
MHARSFWLIALAALMNITQATPGRAADAVNVATPSIVIFAIPYWIAEQKGYFKDENIEPTLEVVANQREIGQRVLNGASQFSITARTRRSSTPSTADRRASSPAWCASRRST